MRRARIAAICAAAVVVPVVTIGLAVIPSAHGANTGDAWLTNSPDAGAGHAHEPHLDCGVIYLHGSSLDASGTYTIDSIPGTGSGAQVWYGTWTTPASGDVIATVSGTALVAAAVRLDNAVANPNQGYHFMLDLSQSGGPKHKTFWVDCGTPPAPAITLTKTADAATVTAGTPVGFTITAGVPAGGFADNVTLSDPLPLAAGLDWAISPAYSGPGTCSVSGVAPALQTLSCAFGDLADPASISIRVASPTTVATAFLLPQALVNTASAAADQVPPRSAVATEAVTPVAPDLSIIKTADSVSVTAGSPVGFTINVANEGPGTAASATVTDPLPHAAGVSWSIPGYGGPGTCSITGAAPSQVLACALGDLASGGSAQVHVVSASPTGTAVSLTNVASAAALNNPPVTGTAQLHTVLPPPVLLPHLTLSKAADAPTATAGQQVGFTLSAGNAGPADALGTVLSDPLPAGGTWAISPAYPGPGTCSITGSAPAQTLSCSLGTLTSGGSATVHVVATTPTGTAVSLHNTALVRADNDPGVTASATVAVSVAQVLGTTTGTPPTTSPPSDPGVPAVAPAAMPGAAALPAAADGPQSLPQTGSNVVVLILPALGLIGVGLELGWLARRRKSQRLLER